MRSQLETDIEMTRQELQALPASGSFIGALSSLSGEYDAFWQHANEAEMAGSSVSNTNRSAKGYFLFEEHAKEWLDSKPHAVWLACHTPTID